MNSTDWVGRGCGGHETGSALGAVAILHHCILCRIVVSSAPTRGAKRNFFFYYEVYLYPRVDKGNFVGFVLFYT